MPEMLVLCYGITKSGSTLTFELIKGVLETSGNPQQRLPNGPVNPDHRINYVQPLNRKRLKELVSAVGDRWIAVKTHSGMADPLFGYLEELQDEKQLQTVVCYRDPRDICLSLVDAGEAARASGRKEFSDVTDLGVAQSKVTEQLEKFVKWASLRDALLLRYDTVAFDPDAAIEQIEQCLGVRADRERVKQYAFTEAFTQRNKATRNRFLSELTDAQREKLDRDFAPIISNFSDAVPNAWLAARRLELIERQSQRVASRHPH